MQNQNRHIYTLIPKTAAFTVTDQSRNDTNNSECEGKKREKFRRGAITTSDSFLITKYSKIAFIEDSLFSTIHDQFILIYGKETTKKYMYKFIYAAYILASIVSSLCGRNKNKASQSKRQKRFQLHHRCRNIPIASLRMYKPASLTNSFSSKFFKYSTRRCKPGIKVNHLLVFVAENDMRGSPSDLMLHLTFLLRYKQIYKVK